MESADGWFRSNGEWTHSEGYPLVNGRILRTTAKPGRTAPKPPGKLALDNPRNQPGGELQLFFDHARASPRVLFVSSVLDFSSVSGVLGG